MILPDHTGIVYLSVIFSEQNNQNNPLHNF